MSPRRSLTAALALTAVLSLVACSESDNGNNTLAEKDHPGVQNSATASQPPAAAPQSTAPAVAGKDVKLEAKDNQFEPAELSVKAGDVTIVMDNTGKAPHTFTAADLQVDVNVDAGTEGKIELKGLKPGKYHFVCKYHEALKMVGDLTVT